MQTNRYIAKQFWDWSHRRQDVRWIRGQPWHDRDQYSCSDLCQLAMVTP